MVAYEVFYDGDCQLCSREVELLRRLDRDAALRFIDIADDSFDPEQHGQSMAQLMAKFHIRTPDGTWIVGPEAFRRLYEQLGFRRLVAISRWPLLSWLAEVGYEIFARHRLALPRRHRASGASCRTQGACEPS